MSPLGSFPHQVPDSGAMRGVIMAALQEEMPSCAPLVMERSEHAGILRDLEQHAGILRLVRKHLLCQGQPVPMQTLLLAKKIPGQSFKLLKEDTGG